jgi:hypothetical protein
MGSVGRRGPLVAAAVVALAVGGAAQSARRAPTHPVVQQTAADCKKLGTAVVVLGQACADERNLTDPETWDVNASSAHWAEDTFGASYEWDVPETIPPAGAPLTLKVAVADLTRPPAAGTCAHLEASGSFTFRTATAGTTQPVGVDACAQAGLSDAKNITVMLVPPARRDTAILRITAKGGPTLTYRYGTRDGGFTFTAAKPKLKASGGTSAVKVTAGRVTARFTVLAEHVRAKTATASLELTAIAPKSLARGCAPGAAASLKLTDAGRRDAARLTARGNCAFLGGAFSNGVAGSATVAVSS